MNPLSAALLLLSTSLALSACSAPVGPQTQPIEQFSAHTQKLIRVHQQPGRTLDVIDVGQGKVKTPAAFAVNFQFQEESGFHTQASTSGGEGKTGTDISDFRVYLFECQSASLPAPGSPGSPVDLDADPNCSRVHDALISKAAGFSGSQSFIFDNVPESSSAGQRFYVGVVALEAALNITSETGYVFNGSPNSNGALALSSSGGNGSGGVHVATGYDVSAESTALGVNVTLLSDKGANLDSNVTVANGNTSYSGSIGVSSP